MIGDVVPRAVNQHAMNTWLSNIPSSGVVFTIPNAYTLNFEEMLLSAHRANSIFAVISRIDLTADKKLSPSRNGLRIASSAANSFQAHRLQRVISNKLVYFGSVSASGYY